MKLVTQFILRSTLLMFFYVGYAGAAIPISISTYAIHSGSNIVYRYQIQNNSNSIIHHVDIGVETETQAGFPGLPWSLNPVYSDIPAPLSAVQCKPFTAMNCSIVVYQFDYMSQPKATIYMESTEERRTPPTKVFSGANDIRPSTLSSVAEITVPRAYQSSEYLSASGRVYLLNNFPRNPDGSFVISADIPFTRIDTTSPTLSVTMSPSVIHPSQLGQNIPITANVTVQDDYDPAPAIKLVDIQAVGGLNVQDIQGVTLNSDDRSYTIVPSGILNGLAQMYLFYFEATDASGNDQTFVGSISVR